MSDQRKSRFAQSAEYVQTLVFFDGPQVLLLKSNRNLPLISVAVDKDRYLDCFFGCEVREKQLDEYFDGRIDLNYLMRRFAYGGYYFFDLKNISSKRVSLVRAKSSELRDDSYFPERGFFSRSHTEERLGASVVQNTEFAINIDGTWDPPEFSRLSTRFSEIYGFLAIVREVSTTSPTIQRMNVLKSAIKDYMWRGGGSYVNFYRDIRDKTSKIFPLNFRRISYASPGSVIFEGKDDVFKEVMETMDAYPEQRDEAKSYYKAINQYLVREKMKSSAPDKSFSSGVIEKYVKDSTDRLAKLLMVQETSYLFELCEKNVAVYAKIVMSLYRRVEGLNRFSAEGRARLGR